MASRPGTQGNSRCNATHNQRPDVEIHNLVASLNQEEINVDVFGLCRERWNDMNNEFEELKRKWEGFTGVAAPKKLKTSGMIEPPSIVAWQNVSADEGIEPPNETNVDLCNLKPAAKRVNAAGKVEAATSREEEKTHPDDELDIVNMIVADLRKELKKRGLEAKGRKAELQQRLGKALKEAKEKREAKKAAAIAADVAKEKREAKKVAVIATEEVKEKREATKASVVAAARDGEISASTVKNVQPCELKLDAVKVENVKSNEAASVEATDCGKESKVDNVCTDVLMEDVGDEKVITSGNSETSASTERDPVDMVESPDANPSTTEKMVAKSPVVKAPAVKNRVLDSPAIKNAAFMKEHKATNTANMMEKQDPPATSSNAAPTPKSALKPSKYSPISTQGTTLEPKSAYSEQRSTANTQMDATASKNLSVPDSSDFPSSSVAEGTTVLSSVSKPQMPVRAATPSGAATKAGMSLSAKNALEKRKAMAANQEARRARIAEMRGKAKPQYQASATGDNPAAKTPASSVKYAASSTLKAMASSASKTDAKPSMIIAQMRERAAAEKASESAASAPMSKIEEEAKPSTTASASTSSSKYSKTHATQTAITNPMALKSIVDPSNKPPVEKEKPLSPPQSYEMSDHEESDSEEDSDEESDGKPKKAVPAWAQKENLNRALEKQFADGPNRMDPDKIFGEVLTCNLEEIFDKKKARYQKRTSSGNWAKDHVTLAEKLTYKRHMGFK